MRSTRFLIASIIAASFVISGCEPTGPRTGSLTITINGLPSDVAAAVTITTPDQTKITATATTTLNDLDPGTYQIAAANAANSRSTFAPANVTSTVEVVAGDTPTQATVTYAVTTGVVAVSIDGVPSGASPVISLIGPGAPRIVNLAGEVGNLAPGTYTVVANSIDSDELYLGVANPSTLTIVPSVTAVPLSVTYSASTGRVVLSPSGLPAGTVATWDLGGPNGFTRTVSASGPVTVTHLAPGQYAASSRNILIGADTYGSANNPTAFNITAGQSSAVSITYIVRPPTLDLTVAAAYLVQSTQNIPGTVPLIAGRDAYLRVFARANENNNAAVSVRVRFYRGGQVIATQTVAAPRGDVPLAIREADAIDSWNAVIPGSVIQPGTSMLVDVDPANGIHEIDEGDNQFPANGSPALLDVRSVPVAAIRFVPIVTGDGLAGNVTESRLSEMVNMTLRIHPLTAISTDLRAPFTTSLVLARSDSNNAWSRILSQIEALRVSEGTGRQYVGVLKDNIGSGIAGIAYRPGRSALVFDENYATETLAHELGHNWNRPHSPCGGPASVDPNFPYANARIGVYGYDGATSRILSSDMPDLMSYCWLPLSFNISTPRRWTSDYTYVNVLNYRQALGDAAPASAARQECLIVWGRVTKNGIVLEPAFVTNTIPVLPSRSGRLRLAALDEAGATITSFSFDPLEVEDGIQAEEHFAYAIPLSRVPLSRLAALAVSGDGHRPEVRTARSATFTQAQVSVTNPRAGIVRFRWDASAAPLLVITDSQSGQILSLATSGDVAVRTAASSFRVKASNGVRSVEMQLRK
jgi:hypothetical protein